MQQYTVQIIAFGNSIQLCLDKNTTVSELYGFLEEQYPDWFRNAGGKNLKLLFLAKNQVLYKDSQQPLERILENNNNCKFELKEQINFMNSNDFINSNEIGSTQVQALQKQNSNNLQVQNTQQQRNYQNQVQQQQVGLNQQHLSQPIQQNQGYQQNIYPPNQQQNQYYNQQVVNQNNFQQLNNNYQQLNPQLYKQTQMNNYQNQTQTNINITIKYKQNQNILEVDSSLTLDELLALFYQQFQIDEQIELFCGNIVLSKMNHELTIIQAGIINNSVIECRQQQPQFQQNLITEVNPSKTSQPDSQFSHFYQQMKFQQAPPQQVYQQVLQQGPPQQVSHPQQQINQIQYQPQSPQEFSPIDINFTIQDGIITRSFSMKGPILLTINNLINTIQQYLGLSSEAAAIQIYQGNIHIQGEKLNFSLQKLQMVKSPLQFTAKVMYSGGQ
ncbi:unnamed protein product [Paramecium pentaurelia]|uniref:Ubiquitin-like domain-containing protein n=1 Tax=Paramecium pentaurelia TaxID=43138 RepID=A0A8S1Y063_9CILI|nr:unnamed protein product [Paramecium pentaurelia]